MLTHLTIEQSMIKICGLGRSQGQGSRQQEDSLVTNSHVPGGQALKISPGGALVKVNQGMLHNSEDDSLCKQCFNENEVIESALPPCALPGSKYIWQSSNKALFEELFSWGDEKRRVSSQAPTTMNLKRCLQFWSPILKVMQSLPCSFPLSDSVQTWKRVGDAYIPVNKGWKVSLQCHNL